jgi:hypothetical protein
MWNLKEDIYCVNEVETQLREKPFRGSQTHEIHYSENKASYKALVLTYLICSSHTFNFDMYLYVNAS